ncbi:glycoside hydrolase family 8 [uncultured Clostridium sp.]|nr:glycoside hydrolase family 8 [uncultured Clostridium sp.]
MKINDPENKYYGAFGNPDGSGIYSFDQCMALLAYAELEKNFID